MSSISEAKYVEELEVLKKKLAERDSEIEKYKESIVELGDKVEILKYEKKELQDDLDDSIRSSRLALKQLGEFETKAFKIDDKELVVSNDVVIGKGRFGVVKQGVWRSAKEIVVKEVELTEEAPKERIIKEFQGQVSCVHPNVLRVFGYSQPSETKVRIVMEKMDMNLLDYLTTKKPGMSQKIDIMKGMVEAVRFLHSQHPCIIHRAIKSKNFLLSKDGSEIKISDFGLYLTMKSSQSFVDREDGQGSTKWEAPEVLGHSEYSQKSDIYSLGITFWEVLFEVEPYPELKDVGEDDESFEVLSGIEFMRRVREGKRPEFKSEEGSDFKPVELFDLCKRCWSEDPQERPTSSELRAWFQKNEMEMKEKYGDRRFCMIDSLI